MSGILNQIVAHKKVELEEVKKLRPAETLGCQSSSSGLRFKESLSGQVTPYRSARIIAEIKPKSPSSPESKIKDNLDSLIAAYNKFACAVSVLTDKRYFGGSLELLRYVKSRSSLPVLRKDFIIDPYQLFEARSSGADAVLLIARILDDELLERFMLLSRNLEMSPVVEVQNEREVATALKLKADIILINNRCLDTLSVDLNTTKRLAALIPESTTVISASGVKNKSDIDFLSSSTRTFLIGTALMCSSSVESQLASFTGDSLARAEARS